VPPNEIRTYSLGQEDRGGDIRWKWVLPTLPVTMDSKSGVDTHDDYLFCGSQTTNELGKVQAYRYVFDDFGETPRYEPVGDALIGPTAAFGFALHAAAGGTSRDDYNQSTITLAVPAIAWPDVHHPQCFVQVFSFDGTTYSQLGKDICSDDKKDPLLCSNIQLSRDGRALVVGPRLGHSGNELATPLGHVRVYEFNGQDWVRKGDDLDTLIDDQDDFYVFGELLEVSADGDLVVASLKKDYETTDLLYTFAWEDHAWVIQGAPLTEKADVISLSSGGYTLSIGSTEGADGLGHVKTFSRGDDWTLMACNIEPYTNERRP